MARWLTPEGCPVTVPGSVPDEGTWNLNRDYSYYRYSIVARDFLNFNGSFEARVNKKGGSSDMTNGRMNRRSVHT